MGAFGLEAGPFRSAVEDEAGTVLVNCTRLLAVYHCGQRILNTLRPFEQQKRDWQRVANAVKQRSAELVAADHGAGR